ncbi:MAG: protein kinase [Eubacteriales bacterium]|nr:protein kinase [Eubacteriales bacterium]
MGKNGGKMSQHSIEFEEMYNKQLEDFCLPGEIRDYLRVERCLKESRDCWTVQARDAVLGRACVVKWARGVGADLLKHEYEILTELEKYRFHGFPHAYRLITDGEDVYFIREYIAGKSLFEITEESGGLSETDICTMGGRLCRIIRQLQCTANPLIHRDIKPENIIIAEDGEMYLVDLGTVRRYREGGSGDTLVMGSIGTAAPEQYGYMQTDQRTDVYAVGRSLWYLAADSYEEEALDQAPVSRRLRKIIRRASAFDPQKRYKSAEALEKALRGCRYKRQCLWAGGCAALAAAVVIFVYLYAAGSIFSHTEKEDNSAAAGKTADSAAGIAGGKTAVEGVVFKEKLIEAAVRKELKLGEQDIITERMLKNVSSIRIVGTRILEPLDEFTLKGAIYINNEQFEDQPSGGISDLSDISLMPNLYTLVLCNQEIKDLTPLEGMYIQKLALAENMIYDISPLEKLAGLEELYIGNNPAVDYSDLGGCGKLVDLNMDILTIGDLHFLEKLHLKSLSLMSVRILKDGMSPLLKSTELELLCINNMGQDEASVIKQMDELQYLRCWGGYDLPDLSFLDGMKRLNDLSIIGEVDSLDGIELLPNLEGLAIDGTHINDLSPILKAPMLKRIKIDGTRITDYTPLEKHPGIIYVECDEAQKQEILKQIPDPGFEITAQ